MDFCTKCGSRLIPKKTKTGKKVAITLECAKCGYTKKEIKKKLSNSISKKTVNLKNM